LLSAIPLNAQSPTSAAPSTKDHAAADFAEKAAVRALTFREGDLASLTDAKDDFAPSAWSDFLKQFEGFLDANGAPQYTSEFAPSGPAAVVRNEDGAVHLRIPGKLTQSHMKSRTVYRVKVDVQVSGTPPKIFHLKPVIYVGTSTAAASK
jgi:hypothetical protein